MSRKDPVSGLTREQEAEIFSTLTTPQLDSMQRAAATAEGRNAARRILLKRERAIAAGMRRYLQLETLTSVRFQKPAWMPKSLYRRLLRSIVIEERASR